MAEKKGPVFGSSPSVLLQIDGGEDIGPLMQRFEWKSFINSGYVVRCLLDDGHWAILKDMHKDYLEKSRKEPTPIEWRIEWPGVSKTAKKLGFLTKLRATGIQLTGGLEFIGIDPPTFWLSAGNCDGSVYTGNVSEVIKQVIQRYAPSIESDIGETKDYNKNQWWQMRQDPKTFIMSLLDWSASVTNNKTNWIVASDDEKIIIKEQAEMEKDDFGLYSMNINQPGSQDIREFEFMGDNFITTTQTKLITQGISAVSGKYLDKITDINEEFVHVKDENTESKINADIDANKGYAKPSDSLNFDDGESSSGATSIMAVPELNAGEMGLVYEDWIDGRARNQFLRSLNLLTRLKIRVNGTADFDDSTKLGVSSLKIAWIDSESESFFMAGKWLIYGWHHVVTPGDWYTDVYLYRLDYDATAEKI